MNRFGGSVKNSFSTISHVIFDMDGLLLDTEPLYTQVTQSILDPFGKIYTPEMKSQIMGMHNTEVAKKLIETYELPITQEEYFEKQLEQMLKLMPDAKLMPDTEKIHKAIISNIAKKYGKKYTSDVLIKLLGTSKQDTCRIAVNEMKLPITPEQFDIEFLKLGAKHLRSVERMPGAEKLVRHLHSKSVPIAVATSSSKDSYELKATRHKEFFSLFNHKVFGGSDPDVKCGKPSPDIFLVCASRFPEKPKPEKCLVIEDAPNGVSAAINAGMQCVMVPDKHIIKPGQMTDATLVLDSLEDFKLELFGLPAY